MTQTKQPPANPARFTILSTSGLLTVGGWCLGEEDIETIHLCLDGTDVGDAEGGRLRADVAQAHPGFPRATHAGFQFSGQIEGAIDPASSHELLLVARDRAGNEKRQSLLLDPTAVRAAAIAGEPERQDTCRLMIDSPRLTLGAMNEPVKDRLFVDGWALGRNGVRSVEIELDGTRLGPASYGQRREDIAGAFPDWDDALLSGFAFHLPARALSALQPGEHQLRVRLVTKDGDETVRGFSFAYERDPDALGTKLLRRHVPFVERQLLTRMLQGSGSDPAFNLFVVADDETPGAERLRATLRSLQSQIHGGWHATIIGVSDANKEALAATLREVLIPPERIEWLDSRDPAVRQRPLASCTYEPGPALYAVIRAGDELACDALAEMVLASRQAPDCDIFTCDDIRNDPGRGEREPFHKPAWSPDLLLSSNYIGRFWCARRSLLGRVKATIGDVLDFGDYDLILRSTEQADAIHHVARLLFHQAGDGDSAERESAALERAIARRGLRAEVLAGCMPGVHRVRRTAPADALVSIIIPTAGAKGHIERCLASLRRLTRHASIEIICVDNIPDKNSTLKARLRENADQVIGIDEAFNWSLFNNIAAGRANGEYLLFLNDDTEAIDETWLESLLEHAQRPEVGVVGPQLLYADGKVQHAGLFLTELGTARHAFRFLGGSEPGYFGLALTQRNVTGVTGACMLIRRDVFDELRGFDEAHPVINNDLDFCLRARRQGLLVIYTPHARLIHHELASRAELKDDYHSPAFDAEWAHVFAAGDPYFSAHLSKAFDDYRREDEVTELIHAGHPLYDHSEIRRMLAVKLDHIGDFITALPALRRLKQHFPEAELYVLASKAARHIAPLEPSIKEVIEFEFFHARSGLGRKEVSEKTLLDLRASLEPYGFDLAVDLRKHSETRPVLRHTCAWLLAGFDTQDENPWLDIAVEWEADRKLHLKRQHVTEDLIRLVDAIAIAGESDRTGIVPERRPAPLEASSLPAEARTLFDKPVAIIHPGVGQETRQWPPEHFTTLIDMLVERSGLNVALIGSPDEEDLAREVMAAIRARQGAVSLVGKIPLADLPRLLASAALYVGNNSGPKHIAAAIGIPTVGIHSGVVDATEWGPLGPAAVAIRRDMSCSPCYIATLAQCFRHYACMRGLEPASVYAVCERMLILSRSGG